MPATLTHAPQTYFFDEGLRFACSRCGQCCAGGPGLVRLTTEEVQRASRFLSIPEGTFAALYCRIVDDQIVLKEQANGDCIFFKNGCAIYPARPSQCRTFPFWIKNLRSEEAWQSAARECPGIGTGPLIDRERILEEIAASPI